VLDEIEHRAAVAGRFIDKDLYQVYITTLWSNVVMYPDDVGLAEADLEPLHDYLNESVARVLGADRTLTDCFRFLNTKAGEQAMDRCRLSRTHRELLQYFCSMILDPEGHRRWAAEVQKDNR